MYELSNGKQIHIDVPIPVKEFLEEFDWQARSQKREDRRYLDFVENVDELGTLHVQPQKDTAAHVIKIDTYNRLYAAIDKLIELQRRRLLMYYIKGLNYSQIADLEGVSIATVARTIERALNALEILLNK